jgi:2'-5' RNA ligase
MVDFPPRQPSAEPATRRLFFALWPDDATRAALAEAVREAVQLSGGRPVPSSNFHITLAFLGHQPVERCGAISVAAREVVGESLELALTTFGFWPRPRILWFGPDQCPSALAELENELWDRLANIGLDRRQRPYQPHVTLARKVAALPEVSLPIPLIWKASDFVLVESVTDERGARYSVAERFSLGSRGDPNLA